MKKYLRILFIFLISIIVIGLSRQVKANSINSISMDIFVDDNGDASVTEIWECNTTQGTEVYHPYYNLGNSEIEDLEVSENGTTYTTLSSWNTSGSLSSKAYKCGINYISNGVELCWGMNSYGSHTYTVKYTITKFVAQLSDEQMIYWTLIPYNFSNTIGKVNIKISSNTYFEDTIDVYGYGNYGGLCYVNNGVIYMESEGRLESSEYMTILAKFPEGTFNTTNILNYDFDYYLDMAEEGATKYSENTSYSLFEELLGFAVPIFFIVFFTAIGILSKNSSNKKYGFKYGEAGKKIDKKVEYYRDIPCEENIFEAYYIAYNYGILKNKTDIMGAILLKWIKDGVVRIETTEGGKIFKKENTAIVLDNDSNKIPENTMESKLFTMLQEASKDGILESKEFENWSKNHYSVVLNWFDNNLEMTRKKLVEKGLIIKEEAKSIFSTAKYIATPELKEKANQIAGLKRYLLDYTLIKDREAIEVELFEKYLIYAQMLGIAKKVSKQFEELYPDMIEQTNYNAYDNIIFMNTYTSHVVAVANSARTAAESYSSGGGGFSSGGGGGGSFGGGGGRRRFPLK